MQDILRKVSSTNGIHRVFFSPMENWRELFKERFQYLKKTQGLTQEKLAVKVDRSQGTVGHWLTGKRTPENLETFYNLALALDLPKDALVTVKEAAELPSHHHTPQPISSIETDPRYIRLPLYDVRAAMGDGEVVGDYIETLEYLPVSKEWIRENLRVPPEIVQLITACGDSMLPEFGRGDPVFIDPRIRHLQGEGVYVFSRYGEVQIKRLQKLMDGRLALLSRNPDYQTDHILPEHLNELHIHARILGAWGFKRY